MDKNALVWFLQVEVLYLDHLMWQDNDKHYVWTMVTVWNADMWHMINGNELDVANIDSEL